MTKPGEYTCAHCKETYALDLEDWSWEDAEAEHQEVFGVPFDAQPNAVVCDDCYNMMIETSPPVKP